jgi:hypothetical protein
VKTSKLLNYKVVECDTSIVIVPENLVVAMPGACNLIIANLPTCCEYLARYTEHRAGGKEIREAHQLALRGANILSRGAMDGAPN